MPNYLLVASGQIGGSFPWSLRMYATASGSEAAVETTWSSGIAAMFNATGFNGILPNTVNVNSTYTSTMDASWKQTTKTQTSASLTGGAAQSLPWHVAEVVTWRTALATRYGRGRWYLPCLGSGSLATAGGKMSATAQTDIVTAVNALLAITVPSIQFVILHRRGTKTGPGPLTTTPIISGDVPDGYDVQRRRADKYVPARTSLTF